MLLNESAVEIPAAEVTENSTQIEEAGLQMEELESRVAPSAAWGT
jgi:hypothetical protein